MTRQAPPVALRTRDVADLTVTAGFPCVSVLLPTLPAPRMVRADRDRLLGLVAEVDRLLHEHGVTSRQRLLRRLTDEVGRVSARPTDRGLAVYVSLAVSRSFVLPLAVEPRALVERTFATRPLVAALHRMPPHVVLVLHPTCAHLYAAADGALRPERQVDPFRNAGQVRLPRPGDPGAAEVRDDLSEAYLRAVDRMLGDYRSEHPSPLVLAGPPALLDRFCALGRHLERLAGRIDTHDHPTALDLALAGAEAVEAYLRTRREDALRQLEEALRERPGEVATGIAACRHAVRSRRPAMLLVEENFISPGEVDAGSRSPAEAVEVHDEVDDLMEQVILRGGQLALVRDGDLEGWERVALISRR